MTPFNFFLKLLKSDIRSYPFSKEVEEFVKSCERILVVEQNRDGQMRQLLVNDIPGNQDKFLSIKVYGGFPISADLVETEIRKQLGK